MRKPRKRLIISGFLKMTAIPSTTTLSDRLSKAAIINISLFISV